MSILFCCQTLSIFENSPQFSTCNCYFTTLPAELSFRYKPYHSFCMSTAIRRASFLHPFYWTIAFALCSFLNRIVVGALPMCTEAFWLNASKVTHGTKHYMTWQWQPVSKFNILTMTFSFNAKWVERALFYAHKSIIVVWAVAYMTLSGSKVSLFTDVRLMCVETPQRFYFLKKKKLLH